MPAEVHRILFIRTDRLGDALMNLPALRLLRQTYPKAWITFAVNSAIAPIFEGHPDWDEVMPVDLRGRLPVQAVRKAHFDMAIISNPAKRAHLLAFLSGIRHRVGYNRKWGFLLNRKIRDEKKNSGRHEIEHNLDLIRLVSKKEWDGAIMLSPAEAAVRQVQVMLEKECPSQNIIAIHPGTSDPNKRWDARHFAQLCSRLARQTQLKPVLIGGAEEKEVSEAVARQSEGALLDWTGRFSLQELAAFFKNPQVKGLVSVDSGPVHVAWISGAPVVALYARNTEGSSPERWGPRDGKSRWIYKPMSEITPDEVFQEVLSLEANSRR
ncbi:MAG: glycosyltransferase family 9 protein [Candidatus Omnitrophica bacterium]|nr:glycosyltransferase family 9 protein [Candidatus Omnitrophota bacterium]